MLPFSSKSWSMTRSREIRWADLPVNSKVIFALDAREERANPKMWSDGLALAPERCIAITETNHATLKCRFAGVDQVVGLTDYEKMAEMIGGEDVYIDVSGLPHSAWAPLLKAAMAYARSVRVMYFEPDAYRYHASPSSVSPFDLSSEFLGVQPLPGFANLRGPKDDAPTVFVPFLGFEGSRSRQVAMTLDPIPKVVPVVGLPGFKLQYPQWALACNQEFLEENSAQSTVRYAAANCPFEAYGVLSEIRRDNPNAYIYLAPIGTKPHAIGAVLFAIDNSHDTEIMFDHPVKTAGRSTGVGTINIYQIKEA